VIRVTEIRCTITAFSIRAAGHSQNQDAVLLGPLAPLTDLVSPVQVGMVLVPESPLLLMVADGLGGHAAGHLASRLVANQLAKRAGSMTDVQAISRCLQEVNDLMYQTMKEDDSLSCMGSTVAGLVLGTEGHLHWFNIGDSPVFVWDRPYLAQLSVDDVPAGRSASSVVTQTIGGTSSPTIIEPHTGTEQITLPARYLVCTDGLTKVVDQSELENSLGGSALSVAWAMIDEVTENGNVDDCSVIIVDLAELPPPPSTTA
jgi:serine/threonine protein phosphatase PrpC